MLLIDQSIVLIGMPGVGKSTVGALMAESIHLPFVDTDLYLQAQEQRTLSQIMDTEGRDGFCRLESFHICQLEFKNSVIATGGSVVYSPNAMKHLQQKGWIVYLQLSQDKLLPRLACLHERGVVIGEGQSFDDLFKERQTLYQTYADITIDCSGKSPESIFGEILGVISVTKPPRHTQTS